MLPDRLILYLDTRQNEPPWSLPNIPGVHLLSSDEYLRLTALQERLEEPELDPTVRQELEEKYPLAVLDLVNKSELMDVAFSGGRQRPPGDFG